MLQGFRVLDLGDEKGVYCTQLLALLGADVIKIEPVGGEKGRYRGPFYKDELDVEGSLYFQWFNTNKRSITLNLETKDGQSIFKELVKTADVVLETFPVGYLKSLGLGSEELRKINEGLIVASITPFGQTGPNKNYKSSDIITMATCGMMQVTGSPNGPPVRLGNEYSHYAPSQFASVAITAALYYRDAVSGKGQDIDISMQEAMIVYALEQHPLMTYQFTGENPRRTGFESTFVTPTGLYPAKDGWVMLTMSSAAEWDTFAKWIYEETGNERILDEKYRGAPQSRIPYVDEIAAMVKVFTGKQSRDDLFRISQERNVVIDPVRTVADVVNDPHLVQGGFWNDIDHPVVGTLKYARSPYDSPDIELRSNPAPLLGQDNEHIYCEELGIPKEKLGFLRSNGII
ncbi:putative Succinyl-CoA--D-citramalate CoA-transferase [Georgfuchsia toluolica]|uniref:Succinyl-CoA--D-citramalate CoA-transferase n=1 Tax=Georgfuchsia toluolica TaxID=424218 RepID=A0A916J704_9PROT|nr:CoA transferase [Georgfuchsia toluolica]CAG4885170.1 putative Succinyl-CoA--D-citramalate CoA-transferase [Georgfuchsia toluolica]